MMPVQLVPEPKMQSMLPLPMQLVPKMRRYMLFLSTNRLLALGAAKVQQRQGHPASLLQALPGMA